MGEGGGGRLLAMMDGLAARLNLSWGYNLSLESGISIAASEQMIAKMKYDGFRIFFHASAVVAKKINFD